VIVAAHQDSVNMWLPYYARSPGADVRNDGMTKDWRLTYETYFFFLLVCMMMMTDRMMAVEQ
jgi:hypothetical protein